MSQSHYGRLIAMAALSRVAMYLLMYAMVDSTRDVYHNLNQLYMAGLMTAPMVVIELSLMIAMFPSKRLNALIIAATVLSGSAFFALLRQQTGISDSQFLRSMIPHHSGAILMCEQASLHDQRIRELCRNIISGQQAEIDQMRALLGELESSR
jgi:uncharacterized protein (DUF305 family)